MYIIRVSQTEAHVQRKAGGEQEEGRRGARGRKEGVRSRGTCVAVSLSLIPWIRFCLAFPRSSGLIDKNRKGTPARD